MIPAKEKLLVLVLLASTEIIQLTIHSRQTHLVLEPQTLVLLLPLVSNVSSPPPHSTTFGTNATTQHQNSSSTSASSSPFGQPSGTSPQSFNRTAAHTYFAHLNQSSHFQLCSTCSAQNIFRDETGIWERYFTLHRLQIITKC